MSFLFYETCTPLALAGYTFFWPIVMITCAGLVVFSVRTVLASWSLVLAASFGGLYARAVRTKKS